LLEHRTGPEGRVSEKWTRFSVSADALILEESIGVIPKVQIHFWVRGFSERTRERAVFFKRNNIEQEKALAAFKARASRICFLKLL
jgi:hypothetical protein